MRFGIIAKTRDLLMPTFLNDAEWHGLIAALVKAAQDNADPESEVAMILSAHVCAESARQDIERNAA